ncbi:MAG: sigma-70 family RNA polymerase sigma factor [Solirubrobacterales bacterium]|nr:sigma-70 family RNA polymerase sigma factor [Solirubrobacterales bacterium]
MALTLSATQAPSSCSEHELVAAVRRGDDRAFEELYCRYVSRVGAYVRGMVPDHARAEDIVQEVFISALRRLRKTERSIVFKPWIYEIAKNACIDEFRRSKRAREVPLETDDELAGTDRLKLSSAATPETAIEGKQRLADLRGAFGVLSESHHKVLVLRELEGLSYGEIGQRLGMSRPMVESTLFRARRRLSEEYEELVSGRRCEQVQAVIEDGDASSPRALGIKQRRQLARHLAHCQACRREARLAGFDESILKPRSLAAKIAALLPFPLLRLRRGGGHGSGGAAAGSHKLAAIQALQNATRFADPSASPISAGRAAAALAALAVAGAGGGIVTGLAHHAGRSHGRTGALDGRVVRADASSAGASGGAAATGSASGGALFYDSLHGRGVGPGSSTAYGPIRLATFAPQRAVGSGPFVTSGPATPGAPASSAGGANAAATSSGSGNAASGLPGAPGPSAPGVHGSSPLSSIGSVLSPQQPTGGAAANAPAASGSSAGGSGSTESNGSAGGSQGLPLPQLHLPGIG